MEVVLTDDNFKNEVLLAGQPVLVDFWAPWCGPCRMMGPLVEELAQEYAGRVKVGKMNVDENSKTPGEYGIQAIPTFILFKGGKAVETLVGGRSKADLKSKIEGLLK